MRSKEHFSGRLPGDNWTLDIKQPWLGVGRSQKQLPEKAPAREGGAEFYLSLGTIRKVVFGSNSTRGKKNLNVRHRVANRNLKIHAQTNFR